MCFPYARPAVVTATVEPEALDLVSELDFLMWLLSLTIDERADALDAEPVGAGARAA
jgi:hypothetical protein